MLQQMSSPLSAQLGEVTPDARLSLDVLSEPSSDTPEEVELPRCKIRRNYNCAKCTFYTQNPRAYLLHSRDVHFIKLKIYDCQHCMYASQHYQKLVRHIKMVHGGVPPPATPGPKAEMEESPAPEPDYEDLLEEIEECDDIQLDEECSEQADRPEDADQKPAVASKHKGKGNFFSCDKCNYVTHIRARYTKHVKYHSMPMIKCTLCDFRTPYKWNLDRHMKNHGGGGSFVCFKCSFTADIKQSLTVHEMNHHTPPVGSAVPRRRNRVGASDAALPKEEEGSADSHSSDMMGQYAEKEIVSCNSDSNEASWSQGEGGPEGAQDASRSPAASDDPKPQKQSRKAPRPIPQLIPLNASTPNQKTTGEPPAKKFKESSTSESTSKFENLPDDITLIPVNNASVKDAPARKKNNSFFDKLKERLLTETGEEGSLKCKACGFESKCLSEHSVHEKNCAAQANRVSVNAALPTKGSTRCQNCRHRCKSSADLYVHMQTCGKKENVSAEAVMDIKIGNEASTSQPEKEAEPHPMENVVFVWNTINQEPNKFDRPLDISIGEESAADAHRLFDIEAVDDSESMNLSPNSLAPGKNVYKCPDCKFWAATASRFHVHIVGHLNRKPFECSLCKYKSNWRWDITKHIKLKSARDPEHNDAKVLMTDETGRRNYSKYNKFLAVPILNEKGENEFQYIDPNTSVDASMDVDDGYGAETSEGQLSYDMQPLNLHTQTPNKYQMDNQTPDIKKPKKTLWKCKKCNYKDASKEALLEHVRQHSKETEVAHNNKKLENAPDPADLAYRCGHCNQLSNWKHVIQRHCRLKHDGIIKVITTVKQKPAMSQVPGVDGPYSDLCTKCPFKANDQKQLQEHLQQHQPSPESIFKCYFCPYFVKDEQDLIQHLLLHGITDPEDYISKAMGCKSPLPDKVITTTEIPATGGSTKRHKCTDCPYETNSKSQYMYHEQFHRLPADTPYKCPECNYSVSKRHLLHQHLRVHGINPSSDRKKDSEADSEVNKERYEFAEDTPYVWVSARNEFHKMYKCRYCSYVNSQKCKLPNHEEIHCLEFENSDVIVYKCLECKFTCDDPEKGAEHSKKHGLLYGRIYSYVEDDVPDEEQIAKLRRLIEQEKALEESTKDETSTPEQTENKIMFFCRKCPAYYFSESEIKVHEKFHDLTLEHKCKLCEFSVAEDSELAVHAVVHSDDYHIKTNMYRFVHIYHSQYRPPRLEKKCNAETSEVSWVVVANKVVEQTDQTHKKVDSKYPQKQYHCKECPAKFFKSSALSYHAGLHNGEGEYKCKKCSYAVKNVGNLAKHEVLHENENKKTTDRCEYESGEDADYKNVPLSGTDLFQRKTEAIKRVLTDKDKLVKPNDHFPPVLQADPQFGYLMHGNPEFIYPTYLKNGRQKEKRYKCHKCPSAFEKREQYKIHLSLHGSKQRYKCELCDYSVKYYANYVQHMRKHQMNDEAQAERKKGSVGGSETGKPEDDKKDDGADNIKLAIKTMPKGAPKSDFQQFSISDQQTLRLLQRRRSLTGGKEAGGEASPAKERKLHMCLLCPYTNQRQDALANHYRRHDATDVLNLGNHKCTFCDLVVVQSHFLRDHLKTHFTYHKNLTPECFSANQDVTFTITKIDEESEPLDLKLDIKSKVILDSEEEKTFVNIKTGEITVE